MKYVLYLCTQKQKNKRSMKQYSHDYTKPSEVESLLYSAQRLMANECYDAAIERINEAREILQKYLAQDNMVEDDDVADGWVKASQTFTEDDLDFIRDLFGEQLAKSPTSSLAGEELAIINKCQTALDCPEFNGVDQFINNSSNSWTEINSEG